MANSLWLYIHFNQLTLDYAMRSQEASNHAPTVVYQKRNNQICQVNQAAREAEIEVGMGLAHATALSQSLNIIDYDENMEAAQLHNLAAYLYQCVAEIALQKPDGLVIRVDNMLRYYGDFEHIWLAIKAILTSQQVNYVAAVAWSAEAAEVLTRQGKTTLITDPRIIRQALEALPVTLLAVDSKLKHALVRSGFRRVGEILGIPATEIGKRFNSAMLTYLYALRGEAYPRRPFYYPPDVFAQSIVLPFEVENIQRLLIHLDKCLSALGLFLRFRNCGTTRITLTLFFRDDPALTLTIRKADLRFQHKEWRELLSLKLETLELPAPVTHFDFNVAEIEEYQGDTTDFFAARKHYFAQQQLIGKLTARLGEESVSTPSWPSDHRVVNQAHTPAGTQQASSINHPLPLFIVNPPIILTGSPSIEFGPVRIESGWWDNRAEKRDYFIARNELGQRMHVFREDSQWFIGGWYA